MTPLDVDRLEFWQAAVMLGRDQKESVSSLEDQLAHNLARVAEVRARRADSAAVASRPERVVRAV